MSNIFCDRTAVRGIMGVMSIKRKKSQSYRQFLTAKENRLGVIILCVGFMALVWVSIKAYNQYFPSIDMGETLYSAANIPTPIPEFVEEVQPEKPKYKKQKGIATSEIEGSWDMVSVKGRALLQLSSDGYYKFAFISDNIGNPNRYSMGQYTLNNGLLILNPSINRKEGRVQFPGYANLTRAKFPIAVAKSGRKLVLYKPDRSFGVYVPPTHPFFALMPDEIVEFSLLK